MTIRNDTTNFIKICTDNENYFEISLNPVTRKQGPPFSYFSLNPIE